MLPSDRLKALLSLPRETEWVEFKEAKQSFSFAELGEYFSALSNEANLNQQSEGWLVFGVQDKPRRIVGTIYRDDPQSLESLKQEVAQHTTGGITFTEIMPLQTAQGRVVLFRIPPAPRGIPVAWKGHWYGRHGESIGALSLHEVERIRSQVSTDDWSAGVCDGTTIDDLDKPAVDAAKRRFAARQSDRGKTGEILAWSEELFLERAKLTAGGRFTRAAIVLLGKPEAARFLSPFVAQITWKLAGDTKAYEHFGPPFVAHVEDLFRRIRNVKTKLQPANQLLPIEIATYDSWIVQEALHNCIVHQDYLRQSRIILTEYPDRLVLENAGSFYEGTVEDYVLRDRTPRRYRNRCLAEAMANLSMIDTMGYGIKRMFMEQRKRFFPLPEYDLSEPDVVRVEIPGRVIDEQYTRILIEQKDLDLSLVFALDKVQKGKAISDDELRAVRRRGLVEGRRPNVHISAAVAAAVGRKADYIRQRGFDDQHYRQMVEDFLGKFGSASRRDIDRLLTTKLPDVLSDSQKATKIHNLLMTMRRAGTIRNAGSRGYPKWILIGVSEKQRKQ